MALSQAKNLGGVGSILMLLGVVPGIGILLYLIGFVLVLVAVKNIADEVRDRSVFNNMILAVVLGIVGILVAVAIFLIMIPGLINFGDPTAVPVPEDFLAMEVLAAIFLALGLLWIFMLISAVFLRRSYTSIADHLGVGMFSTVGLLYLIGAATVILFGLGLLIVLIAVILQIVAFFSIPEAGPETVQQAAAPPTPPPAEEAETPPPME